MGLNSEQLAELGRYVAVNDRAGYYELLSSYGVDYGTQALGVVDADTLSGAAANIFLKWTAQETSAPISNETLARLSVELLKADYAARSVSGGADLGYQEVQDYHNSVFANFGLSADAWTPNFALNLLTNEQDKVDLWTALMESSPVVSWYTVIANVFGQKGFNDPASNAYILKLTDAGVDAGFFPSNQYGLYEVEYGGGLHIIGDNQTSGPTSGYIGTDVIMGFDGEDVINGKEGGDFLYGGLGDDYVFGNVGNDELHDGLGIDVLEGGLGDDTYRLFDDDEADIVVVGEGSDTVIGGDESDRIVLRAALMGFGDNVTGLGEDEATTGIPLLGGFIDDGDIASGEFQAGYVPATQAVYEVTLDPNIELIVPVTHTTDTGPSLWNEITYTEYGDIDPGQGTVYHTITNFPLFNIIYSLSDGDLNIDISYSDTLGVGVEAHVTIKDFEIGDFGIDFFEYSTTPTNTNHPLPPGREPYPDTWYADDSAGVEWINNDGDYITIKESPDPKPRLLDGSDDNDVLIGTDRADAIFGRDGDDYLAGNDGDDLLVGGAGIDTFYAGDGDDRVVIDADDAYWDGGNGYDTLVYSGDEDISYTLATGFEAVESGGGNDTLADDGQDNILNGGAGDDTIQASAGNDTLIGGEGDDQLSGGAGDDNYIYNLGDGSDTVAEAAGQGSDAITLKGIVPGDLTFARHVDDLEIAIAAGGSLTIVNAFSQTAGTGIESVVFGDNTVWDRDRLLAAVGIVNKDHDQEISTASSALVLDRSFNLSDDSNISDSALIPHTTIFATSNGDQEFYEFTVAAGEHGIFDIDGASFNTVIDLFDASGTWIAANDDSDTDAGSTAQSSYLEYVFANAGTYRIRLSSYDANGVGSIPDGSTYTLHVSLEGKGTGVFDQTLVGTSGDDILTAAAGNDTLTGSEGYDQLFGGTGDDTYVYNLGDGFDAIVEAAGEGTNDTLVLNGFVPGDLTFARRWDDLDIVVSNYTDPGDAGTVTIVNAFSLQPGTGIEKVVFGNNTIWDRDDLLAAVGYVYKTYDQDINTVGSALVLDRTFTLAEDADITDSTLVPHTTIFATTSGGQEYYAFTVSAGERGIFDIDGASFDTVIDIYDANGTWIAANDDSIGDAGSTLQNSYLDYTFVDGGTYFVRLSSWDETGVGSIADGADYSLHISLEGRGTGIFGRTLVGTSGDDILTGTAGDDTIRGNGGDDTIRGNGGDDTYIYQLGSGNDLIQENGLSTDIDTLRLIGLTASDLTFSRSIDDNSDVVITTNSTGEQITIDDQTDGLASGIEKFEFADGSTWDTATISVNSSNFIGTVDAEIINGTAGDDTIRGNGGDDTLHGNGGDDTYVYQLGSGNDLIQENGLSTDVDTLRFIGLNASDLTFGRSIDDNSDVVITTNATGEQITIDDQTDGLASGIEMIEFADGSTWDIATISVNSRNFIGTVDAEVINGTAGDDTIRGNGGDDTLHGNGGDDTYVYQLGSGNDLIQENGLSTDVDTLRFVGLNASDLTFSRSISDNDDVVITTNATGEQVTIDDQALGSASGIEYVQFADGSTWDAATLLANSQTFMRTAGIQTLSSFSGSGNRALSDPENEAPQRFGSNEALSSQVNSLRDRLARGFSNGKETGANLPDIPRIVGGGADDFLLYRRVMAMRQDLSVFGVSRGELTDRMYPEESRSPMQSFAAAS